MAASDDRPSTAKEEELIKTYLSMSKGSRELYERACKVIFTPVGRACEKIRLE